MKEITLNSFGTIPTKKKIGFNFTKEIPLKLNRTKKKVYQKIELTFNFTKEIHVKISKIAFNFQKKSHEKKSPSIYKENPT